jgi:hypothetical protein
VANMSVTAARHGRHGITDSRHTTTYYPSWTIMAAAVNDHRLVRPDFRRISKGSSTSSIFSRDRVDGKSLQRIMGARAIVAELLCSSRALAARAFARFATKAALRAGDSFSLQVTSH